ncbi:hypothetical protein RJ640_024138 [Escallonia rubra]|uniref:N-acetyltransferase domain-containing protein n=1 Tax=Escallonia rubra TaxID=112253 RepID=A0AA88RA45_9ASTE|nr:hypothetical protein RJ640_024138 [Escallonia rubra]
MAVLATPPLPIYLPSITSTATSFNCRPQSTTSVPIRSTPRCSAAAAAASQLFTNETLTIDKSSLNVAVANSEGELWAASCLRVRSFYSFQPSFGIEDHKRYLTEREFEALKERVTGKRVGFGRVSCINATLPVSQVSGLSDDICSAYDGEDRVVVGTLDLNRCLKLPDEITGMKPKGIGADFARAYLSNVCVAKEMLRNGIGYTLVTNSKMVAEDWGVSDLYVHVAVDNEPAKNLYMKSGFVYESDEPARQARISTNIEVIDKMGCAV